MIALALDVESTGLSPVDSQMLEICGIVFDVYGEGTIATFHEIVNPRADTISGNPYALAMNAGLIQKISDGQGTPGELVSERFDLFLQSNFGFERVVIAAKNPSFDISFAHTLGHRTFPDDKSWQTKDVNPAIRFHRRTIDPAILYMQKGDSAPPDLKTCLLRAGIEQGPEHEAASDAMAIVNLVQHYYRSQS